MRKRWNWRRKCGVCVEVEDLIKKGIAEVIAINALSVKVQIPMEEIKDWLYRYRKFGGISLRKATGKLRGEQYGRPIPTS